MPYTGITADQFLDAGKYRRSVYPLKNTSAVSDERVAEIIEKALSFSPSSYNTQPVRVTLVVGEKHKELWELVSTTAEPLLKGAGEAVWETMSGQFKMFGAAYGSVRFQSPHRRQPLSFSTFCPPPPPLPLVV